MKIKIDKVKKIQIKRKKVNDFKHISWLFKNMAASFLNRDFETSKEAYYLLKIHRCYKSKKLRN